MRVKVSNSSSKAVSFLVSIVDIGEIVVFFPEQLSDSSDYVKKRLRIEMVQHFLVHA
jgi:hypothetical protein